MKNLKITGFGLKNETVELKEFNYSPKTELTNSLVKGISSVLGGIHMVSSIIADSSLNAEININKKYYTKDDGSKLNNDDIKGILRNRLLRTESAKEKLGIKPINIEDIFNEVSE